RPLDSGAPLPPLSYRPDLPTVAPRSLHDALPIFDVGCGTGRLAAQAERAGRTVTALDADASMVEAARGNLRGRVLRAALPDLPLDRKSTRLNSSHVSISYAVFCLKKKNGRGAITT